MIRVLAGARPTTASASRQRSRAADELDAESGQLPAQAAAGAPAWANTPLGRQVSALVDALVEAGRRISPPPDDADEQALRGWIASKRALLGGPR